MMSAFGTGAEGQVNIAQPKQTRAPKPSNFFNTVRSAKALTFDWHWGANANKSNTYCQNGISLPFTKFNLLSQIRLLTGQN